MTLTKVRSGQPLTITAEAFNAFIDAANAQRGSGLDQQAAGTATTTAAGIVTVRNDSGADQERFAVLGIDAPLILPTENPAAFQERVALSLVAPDADQHRDRMCILQEPIAAGALGRGLIVGVSPMRLQVQADDDRMATIITDDASALTTGAEGAARILWKEAGTGAKWGLVQIPAGGAGGGSPNLVVEVVSANHPWLVGDVLRWSGAGWVFADAAVVGATDTLAVVGRIPDADTALLVLWGICCIENLAPHTDYWLDPVVPGALTATKPSETPRLVLHHAENGLCILRAGGDGGEGSATRFADLTDVDVVTVPPIDRQAALWDVAAERWKPRSVLLADPVPPHQVPAGPASGADAPPTFRDLAVEDLAEVAATSVIANPTASAARPTALPATVDDRALLRVGGTLQWLQIPEAVLGDAAMTTRVLSDDAVTDPKIVSLGWGKLTGVPTQFPPLPHEHPLGGDLTGTTAAAQIAANAVGTPEIADGAVTLAKLGNTPGPAVLGRVTNGAGSPGSIMAPTDGGVLRRSSGSLGFAQITNLEIANGAAIAWSKISKAGAVAGDVGAAPASHTHPLSGLSDVLITAPTVGQVLAYDAVNGRWINDDGGGGPGAMRPLSVWVNPTNVNAEGIDLPATIDQRVLIRVAGSLSWGLVTRSALTDGTAYSVMGRSTGTAGPVADIAAAVNTTLRRGATGDLSFGKITLAHIDSGQTDGGWVMTTDNVGAPQWNRTLTLGKGAGTPVSVQGAIVVVISNNGDYAKISSGGIELFRRSVSTVTPLVKLDLNAYGAWTVAKAMGIREVDVCENGIPKKMLVLASATF